MKMKETLIATDDLRLQQERMINRQLRRRGVYDPSLLAAMMDVPRHHFVPAELQARAYEDRALPIGTQQTISQPYIVAYMIDQLRLREEDELLEIGTGTGYQTAILAHLVKTVVRTVEIDAHLSELARERLQFLEIDNVALRVADGYEGWVSFAPYDAIIVSAAPEEVPEELWRQLKVGGRLVIPVRQPRQEVLTLQKTAAGQKLLANLPARFVPMVHA